MTRRLAAGVLALTACPCWGQAGQTPALAQALSRGTLDYLGLAQPYREGAFAEAIRAIRRQRILDLNEAQKEIARHPQLISSRQIDEKDLEALVALHTETALVLARGRDAVGAEDQLQLAARLLEWITSHAARLSPLLGYRPSIDRVSWLRTAIALAVEVWIPELALDLMDEGLKLAPDDARMNLAVAIAEEALFLAGSRRGSKAGVGDPFPGVRRPVSPADHRRQAHARFRRVVELDRGLVEAQLRLARLLLEDGNRDEALAHLERARDTAATPRERYLATLLLGRAHEAGEAHAKARSAYAEALALYPRAQAPRLALARIAENAGEPGVRAGLRPLLAEPWGRSAEEDPWWLYPYGPPGVHEQLAQWRAALRK
ncbi:MAG: tetratricopeptide repeat protein [Vicinamibacteria bacterium]